MVPPRIPQFNWIDLGLPSGTLWLDRMVGAPSPTEAGLFYQWGDTIGHSADEGYDFSEENYTQKGLNLISSNLDNTHDAARAYYGPEAKMPSFVQIDELKSNCVISDQGNGVYLFTSNINGHSFKIRGNGYMASLEHASTDYIRSWCTRIRDEIEAWSLHVDGSTSLHASNPRIRGYNIMAVHS